MCSLVLLKIQWKSRSLTCLQQADIIRRKSCHWWHMGFDMVLFKVHSRVCLCRQYVHVCVCMSFFSIKTKTHNHNRYHYSALFIESHFIQSSKLDVTTGGAWWQPTTTIRWHNVKKEWERENQIFTIFTWWYKHVTV